MERLTDGLKKILLAGIGTVAVTAEKSKEVLDEMVKRLSSRARCSIRSLSTISRTQSRKM